MTTKPYFETVRDLYVKLACDFYKLAAEADFETGDPAAYLNRGRNAETKAHEAWPVTTRQDRRLGSLKAQAELNTREGRELRDRIIAQLSD